MGRKESNQTNKTCISSSFFPARSSKYSQSAYELSQPHHAPSRSFAQLHLRKPRELSRSGLSTFGLRKCPSS